MSNCVGIIYCWTSPSGRKYIGKDSSGQRKRKFLSEHLPYTSPNWSSKIDRARKKYGVESFQYDIIQTVTRESLEDLDAILSILEIMWIRFYDTYNSGYNSTKGGEGVAGFITSEETKQKQREAKLGCTLSEEHKQHIRDNAANKKRIAQYDMLGNLIEIFNSIADASRATGINKNTISYQLNHSKRSGQNKYNCYWVTLDNAVNNVPTDNAITNLNPENDVTETEQE